MQASHTEHLDPLELEILTRRDALGFPPKDVCDTLVGIFFDWIAPILPVVERHKFMKQYQHPEDPPSALLLQAIFTVASRFSINQQHINSSVINPRIFYRKAKALYDAGYEQNPITVIQAVVLLGLYWDGLDDLVENGIFYWSRLGVALAQAEGFHASEKYIGLDSSEKRLRKRIWWTLFTRDRSVAAAFGRPLSINSDDCTVDQLTENDFIEYDDDNQSDYPASQINARFFMEYVKLCQLMDLGLCLTLSSRSTQDRRVSEAAQCELGLNEWLVSCPSELHWRQTRHKFLSAVLFSTFYTIVCQLQLLQEPNSSKEAQISAFNAASTIISILETLHLHKQIQYTPSFIICHAVVSFVTLKHQMNASVPSLLHAIRLKLEVNLEILEELTQTWPIARFFLELFHVMSTPGHFNQLLAAAVEECQRCACGDSSSGSNRPRQSGPFKRPKIQQVILPQSKVVLQILARESQKRSRPPVPASTASTSLCDVSNSRRETTAETRSHGIVSGHEDGTIPSLEDYEPTVILQSLQNIIQIGRFGAHDGNSES